MGRVKEQIDMELSGMKFSDQMMKRVLERTWMEEKDGEDEYWILPILDTVSEKPLSGLEILLILTQENDREKKLHEEDLYPLLHRLTEEKLLKSSRQRKQDRERTVYELTSLGKTERKIRKVKEDRKVQEENLRGFCHGEG